MRFCKKGILIPGLLAVGIGAHGQIATPKSDSTVRGAIREVVITGQYRAASPENAVQQIRVIGRAQIDAMAAQNLRDVLTNEPNIRISQDNILGSSMTMQGLSGNSIKYLIDGVPIIGRQDGNIDLSQVNLNNIERIEIIKGPMSVTYGNNALGGTINLITKKAQQKTYEANLNAYYERIGTYNLTGRAGLQRGAHNFSLSGGRNYFDGWSSGEQLSFSNKAQPADTRRFQSWKPREQYFGDGQYSFKRKATTLTYRASLFEEEIVNRGYPDKPYGETASDDYYKTRRFDNAVFLNTSVWKGKTLNAQVAYNQYRRIKNTYARDLTTLGSELSQNPGAQDTTKFTLLNSRVTLSGVSDEKLSYEFGYDINIESGKGIRIKDDQQSIGDYAIFASAEYKPLAGLTVRPGFRYAYNTRYKAPVTSSINVRYGIGHWIFRGAYAKGFRSPDLKELYFYFVDVNHNIKGNENLQAERSDNYTGNIAFTDKAGPLSYKVEANGFYTKAKNRILLATITGTEYTYINIGNYRTHGAELNSSILWQNLSVSVGGTYTGLYNELSESEAVATYSYTPEIRASILYELKEAGLSAALFYKYTGRLPGFAMPDTVVKSTYTEAYSTADASISKRLFRNRIRLTAGVKNIFDVQYVNAFTQGSAHSTGGTSIPMSTGRNYFLKIDFNFQSQ